jgi:biopolymer transport protein ExbD
MRLAAQPLKRSTDWVLQLINIVFLCLLFFLVNGTIATQQDREIVPPRSILIGAGTPPSDAVYVDATGLIKFRGKPATVPEVAATLHREAGGPSVPWDQAIKVEIVADRRLNAARLVDLLSEFRHLDIGTLSLVTLRDTSQ